MVIGYNEEHECHCRHDTDALAGTSAYLGLLHIVTCHKKTEEEKAQPEQHWMLLRSESATCLTPASGGFSRL